MRLLFATTPAALGGMVAAVFNAALRVAIVPLFITPVFDRVLLTGDLSALGGVFALAAALAVGGALMLFLQDALLGRAAARVSAAWRVRLYRGLLSRPPGSLPSTSGGLSGRILSDLKDIETYYSFGLGTLVAESVTIVGILAVLLLTDAQTTLLLFLFGLPLGLFAGLLGRRLETTARESQAHNEEVGAHLQEGFKHHEVVRAFRLENFMLERFRPTNEATARTMTRRSLLASLQTPLMQVLVFAAVALLIAVLANSVARGAMTAGEVLGYLMLVALLATPSQLLPKGYALLQQAKAAGARLRELEPLPSPIPSTTLPPEGVGTTLELRDLSFTYRTTPVLQGLSATFNSPGLIALTGESGNGKTTLLKLLLGFLTPSSGHLLLNGQALEAIPEERLRELVAYVPQDGGLLRGTLRENLCLGRDYLETNLWAALQAVDLSAVVRSLPEGLDYTLREDGIGLSGGQRQRLAVARALLREPRILLLDEPSANLDEASERALVHTLKEEALSRLVIVVAHRPALIQAAQTVYHLNDGCLEEILERV